MLASIFLTVSSSFMECSGSTTALASSRSAFCYLENGPNWASWLPAPSCSGVCRNHIAVGMNHIMLVFCPCKHYMIFPCIFCGSWNLILSIRIDGNCHQCDTAFEFFTPVALQINFIYIEIDTFCRAKDCYANYRWEKRTEPAKTDNIQNASWCRKMEELH